MPSATSPATSVIFSPTAARNTFGAPCGFGPGREERRHQRVRVEVAAEVELRRRRSTTPRSRASRGCTRACARGGMRPRHREALLDVRLDLRAEPEDEAAVRRRAGGRWPMYAVSIGVRANATAMPVPSSMRSVCSAAIASGRNGSSRRLRRHAARRSRCPRAPSRARPISASDGAIIPVSTFTSAAPCPASAGGYAPTAEVSHRSGSSSPRRSTRRPDGPRSPPGPSPRARWAPSRAARCRSGSPTSSASPSRRRRPRARARSCTSRCST